MALKFEVEYRKLDFLFKAGTSRGVLDYKKIWIIKAFDANKPLACGFGEAGPLVGLSIDDIPDFEHKLKQELTKLENSDLPLNEAQVFELAKNIFNKMPSVQFGVETALLDLVNGGKKKHFENEFYELGKPIQINGLVWMGSADLMLDRLTEKMEEGFRCIKIKIGAVEFDKEIALLEKARNKFTASQLELRVDANGAFTYEKAKKVLKKLHELEVHSIEQPIKAGKVELMAKLCAQTQVDIALDEELIGITSHHKKQALLEKIKPQYIILKPSLLGGFASTLEWINIAESLNINWWITSALESNIGLNAICQFSSSLKVTLPQGLGTGSLYKNNIASPLKVVGDKIIYDANLGWDNLMK